MDFSNLNLPDVGWATAVALALILAGMVLARKWRGTDRTEAKRAQELKDAEAAYRAAVDSRDPDRIHLAAVRLCKAQQWPDAS